VQCSYTTTMPSTLRLNCLIEGEDIVFVVSVGLEDVVSELKKLIRERALDSLKDVDPYTLELWKVSAINKPLLCKMTLLLLAQGTQFHRRQAKQHSHSMYQAPGLFKIYRQIRGREQRLQYISNRASQRLHPHNRKGPAYQ
jgi:hypothetical protein